MCLEWGVLRTYLRNIIFESDYTTLKFSPFPTTTMFGGIGVPMNLGDSWHSPGSGLFLATGYVPGSIKTWIGPQGWSVKLPWTWKRHELSVLAAGIWVCELGPWKVSKAVSLRLGTSRLPDVWVTTDGGVQSKPTCYQSRMSSVHLYPSFRGNLKWPFLTPPRAYLLPKSPASPTSFHSTTLYLSCLLYVSFPPIHLEVFWDWSTFLFISSFQCLPQYLETGRVQLTGWMEGERMRKSKDGRIKQEWPRWPEASSQHFVWLCILRPYPISH